MKLILTKTDKSLLEFENVTSVKEIRDSILIESDKLQNPRFERGEELDTTRDITYNKFYCDQWSEMKLIND